MMGKTFFTTDNIEIYFQSKRAGIEADLATKLITFIEGTQNTLDCAIYDLRDPNILAALHKVSEKCTLRIAYDAGKERTGGSMGDPKPSGTEQAIEDAGLTRYAFPVHHGNHLMHDKFLIRDGESIWSGSANFTIGGLKLQDNNCLILKSKDVAQLYRNDFEHLLKDDHHENGFRTPNDKLPINATTSVTPSFSPEAGEAIEDAVIAKIKDAQKLRILAFLISDPGILQSLLPFQGQEKDIRGVYDPHGMQSATKGSHKNPALFWFLNDPRFVAAPSHAFNPNGEQNFMHNKVMIIDDRYVITGSYNFSENAELNDENILIIDSKIVAAEYTNYFDTLFKQYSK
jgi:PLD-like domain